MFGLPLSRKLDAWKSPAGMSVPEIEAIVGWDHKRYYGDDFVNNLENLA